jgi:hypothetical protein
MNRNLTFTLCFIALQICFQHLHAQSASKEEDVMYLKNGWILRGSVSSSGGDSICIITGDRNRYIFANGEVDHVSHEKKKWTEGNYRNNGFGHFTEIGALAATKNRPDNVTTAAFSFQTVNGFRFSERLFTGLGIAADLYATQTTIPLFASIRGDLLTRGLFVPYYFVDGGYGFDITSSTTEISYKSGPMFAAGIGFKVRFSNVSGFHVNFGYRMQKGATIESGIQNNYTNNRIAMRAGFYL